MTENEAREAKGGKSKKIRGVIDRIEDNDIAVVLLGEDGKTSIDVPTSLLPQGAKDGDHLSINITLDAQSRQQASDRAKAMRDRLEKLGGATAGQKDFKL